jgi:soluble lytic murein transglycosylase
MDFNLLKSNPDPVAAKLLTWLYVTDTNFPAASRDMIHFSLENSGWPRLSRFRDKIEKNPETAALPPAEIAAWFDQNPPRTAKGLRAYLSALLALGKGKEAKASLKKFWLEAELDKKETAALATQYKKLFFATDHPDRLDNLLWEQRYTEAESMMPLVSDSLRKLAQARIGLGRLASKADKLTAAVPASLRQDNGLLLDRLRWMRQMGKDDDAYDLLQHAPKNMKRPDLWWRERHILARRAMEEKDFSRAYQLVLHHGLPAAGFDYSQAEWLLGWLSLEFLNKPDTAYQHFDKFYSAVSSAVSRSRATYWLARAADRLGQKEDAKNWDTLSAQFPSTFYGQLSHEKLYGAVDSSQFLDDQVPAATLAAFEQQELVRAARILAGINQPGYIDPFLAKLLDGAKTRADFVMTARLARETNRPYYSVEANKQLQQRVGEFMFTEGYPLLPALPVRQPESALVHAIVHRESMFDVAAVSSSGALGLMQLMPGTAKQVSGKIGKSFAAAQLTANPQYNVELGASYLQSLLDRYNGFYPLAIAAYNAGPGNVDQWIGEFGDPRSGKVDLIDWIEQIPIYETRNYVQRVMESYYIYRLRVSEKPKTVLAFGKG